MQVSTLRGLVLIASTFALVACAKKDPVAGLEELPAESAKALMAVPNAELLATFVDVRVPAPTSPPATAHCAANATTRILDAQITMPITVCQPPFIFPLEATAIFFSKGGERPFKLTDAGVLERFDARLRRPWWCTTSNGPWMARITQSRGCVGTCSPYNQLVVLNIPTTVGFGWYGGLEDHPPGFEFVGDPVLIDSVDLGPCSNPG